jgi:hypothetical protein
MLPYRQTRRLQIEDFRVRPENCPGWVWGNTRLPRDGEAIFCAAGSGTVTALHGKTGDGSRLIQIELAGGTSRPFFAAASNVLLPPADGDAGEGRGGPGDGSREPRVPGIWLGGSGSGARFG